MNIKAIIDYFTKIEQEIADLKYEIAELKEEIEYLKKDKKTAKQKLLSTKEAAIILNIQPQTVRNYVNSGRLGCLKGKGMRDLKFKQEHIDDFIKNQNHYRKSNSQLKSEIITARYTKPELQVVWK
jgi:excisionase family DNA binding protein